MAKISFFDIFRKNPVTLNLLGIVPILGTTIFAKNALAMGISTALVLIFSNLFISVFKSYIKPQTELIIYVLVTSVFTTILTIMLKVYFLPFYVNLGIYLPLITVNCLIMNQLKTSLQESLSNSLVLSIVSSIQFIIVIVLVGVFREILGSGSVFGYEFVPDNVLRLLIVNTSTGGFFTLAFFAFLSNILKGDKE